jgi:Carboxypeptidase regulatory-like domain/TonB dependent receptor
MKTNRRRPRATGMCRYLQLFVAMCVLSTSDTSAQGLSGALIGTVRDAQGGAVSGAVVHVSSPALIGGPAATSTNEKGQWRFPVLPAGTYTIQITHSGFAPHREEDMELGAGATLERTVALQLAALAESVVVKGEGSRLEARHPGFGTRFDAEDVRTIPTRRSSMFDFIRAAPGISPTSPSSGTVTTVSAFGSGINANMFLIDGTNFTCPCIGIARSEPGIDFIQEIQIQSVGASAEYGNLQGAVINVITRQGGERFLFDASWYWQASGLTSQPVRLPVRDTSEESGYERGLYRDVTTNLGGPVVHERLWFFTGYQHVRDSDSQPGTDPRFPRRYEQDKVIVKLTWRPAARWQVFSSFHDEFWVNPQQPTIARPFEATLRPSASVPAITFGHVTHTFSDRTVWDVRVGRFVYSENSRPSTGILTTAARRDAVTGFLSGAPERFGSITLGRSSVKATLSHYRPGLFRADHEWKLGGQVEDGGHHISSVAPTGERFVDSNGQPSEKVSKTPSHIGGQFVTAAAFVSDAVTVGDRLTINAGLRFEHNRAISQDLHAIDLEGRETSEIVQGLGTLYTWNVFSPRLGITNKVGASGRTILRASYGRFYQGVLTAELDQFHPGATPAITTNMATGQSRVEDPRVNLRLDPATRAPFTDEYSVGVDRELGRSLVMAIAYVRKKAHDTIGWTDIAGQYREETRALADGRSISVLALDTPVTPPSARRFLLTNQDDYSATYNGLVVAVDKRRVNGWQAFASYTWSRAYGLQPSSGATAAGEQTNTIGPGGIFGRDPNDLTNARGRLPNDRPHVLRAMAAVEVPRTGLLFAANLQHFSGKPWAATAVVALPQNREQRILLEPRGSRRLSSQTLLDLRLSRSIRAGRLGRLELLVDVLNALNETAEEGIVTDAVTTAVIQRVPTFGMPNVFVDPRRAMVGVRINVGRP